MGVILIIERRVFSYFSIPHIYGGDPFSSSTSSVDGQVFPIYMGVIPIWLRDFSPIGGIPHIYGGDPEEQLNIGLKIEYSPYIWG